MKPSFLCDIDDVVRDLGSIIDNAIGKPAEKWEEGKVIFDVIKSNPELLISADKTVYCDTLIRYLGHIKFVSQQISEWRSYTDIWLKKNIPSYEVLYVDEFSTKDVLYSTVDYAIEDYPYLNNYDNVIVVDRLYNRNISNPYARVCNNADLIEVLGGIYGNRD